MFCELLPNDMRDFPKQSISPKMVLPYSTFTNYCNGLNGSSCNGISPPTGTDLMGNMRYPEFNDDKFSPPENMDTTLPSEMPDLQSMEVDIIQSDKDIIPSPPSSEESKTTSNEQEFSPPEMKPTVLPVGENFCKDVKVQCLESILSLEKKCEQQGLKLIDCSDYYYDYDDEDSHTSYEVDVIYDHKVEEGERYYYIKWKNYASSTNTWEPYWHLDGCKEMIKYYHITSAVTLKKKLSNDHLTYFVRDLVNRKPCDILTLTKVCALCFDASEDYVHSLKLTRSDMKAKVKQILTFSDKKIRRMEDKLFEIMKYRELRKRTLINLKEWESEINAENPEDYYVTVENDVDLEPSPKDFIFIHDYINTVTVRPSEPVTFCNCGEDCYSGRKSCCPNDSDGKFAYSRHKKLILEPGYPIFECNDRCNCPMTCTNRVVQHGQKVKVAIFRTPSKGWGLKALESIEKGEFVLEYLGEIITSEVAEERGRKYDYVARSYLFDLDYGIDSACCYTVDAGHVGNVAHFINHSCDPNLHVFAVWINEQDPCLPRLAFFAKRKVYKGEELTFDYKMSKESQFEDSENSQRNHRIPCRCKSRNCRKYLF